MWRKWSHLSTVLAAGVGGCGLAGCLPRVAVSDPPLPPRPVYVNMSVVVAEHPAWREARAYRSEVERLRAAESEAAQTGPLPTGPEVVAPGMLRASHISSRFRSQQMARVRRTELEHLENLRMELQREIEERTETRRAALESALPVQLRAKETELDRRYAEKLAELPSRYAYPLARLELRLTAGKLSEAERRKVSSELAALQNEWRSELSKLSDEREADLREEHNRLQHSLQQELETYRRTLSREAIEGVRRDRRQSAEDLLDAEAPGPLSGPELETPLPPSVAKVVFQNPDPRRYEEERRQAAGLRAGKMDEELTSLRAYVTEDSRRSVGTILRKHRWEPVGRGAAGVPDETAQVLRELREDIWKREWAKQEEAATAAGQRCDGKRGTP